MKKFKPHVGNYTDEEWLYMNRRIKAKTNKIISEISKEMAELEKLGETEKYDVYGYEHPDYMALLYIKRTLENEKRNAIKEIFRIKNN